MAKEGVVIRKIGTQMPSGLLQRRFRTTWRLRWWRQFQFDHALRHLKLRLSRIRSNPHWSCWNPRPTTTFSQKLYQTLWAIWHVCHNDYRR